MTQVILGLAWPLVALVGIIIVARTIGSFRNEIARAIGQGGVKGKLIFPGVEIRAEIGSAITAEDARAKGESAELLESQSPDPTIQKDVNTERLILRDSQGRGRATLFVTKDSSVLFGMYGENGEPGLIAVVEKDSRTGIELYSDGKVAMKFNILADGRPFIAQFDNNGHPRSIIGLSRNGTPAIGLLDETEQVTWSVPAEN
jgi:hypothetical protein